MPQKKAAPTIQQTPLMKKHFARLIQLTPDEASILESFSDLLRAQRDTSATSSSLSSKIEINHHQPDLEEASAEYFGSFNPRTIFKLSNQSRECAAFCRDSSLPHTNIWAETLQKNHCIYFEIPALTGGHKCSVFDQYVGNWAFQQVPNPPFTSLTNQERELWLDIACAYHSFDALYHRCLLNQARIAADQDVDFPQLLRDTAELANFYRSTGYMAASVICKNTASLLKNLPNERAVLAKQFEAKAQKYFQQGSNLFHKQSETDIKIIDVLGQGHGLQKIFGFQSLKQAKRSLFKSASTSTLPTTDSDSDADHSSLPASSPQSSRRNSFS